MTTPALLLDTCAVLWLFNGSAMANPARRAITSAAEAGTLHVSPFSAWEIGTLVSKRKIALNTSPQRWFRQVVEHRGVRTIELTHDVLMDSFFLPDVPPNDPADRIMIATARALGLVIVTRDRPILDYSAEGHVSSLEC
jgi:PIN domain nuclease of toxin-antitoxin system